MKPIENMFGFDCGTCEYNRHCYGGNMGNQFRYCEKSAKKIQNLDNLAQENKQMKDNWNKLKEWLKEYEEGTYGLGSYETGLSDGLGDVIKKMQEIEGSRE